MKSLISDLGLADKHPVPILCDNKGTVLITSNESSAQRTRHLGAQLNFAREQHENRNVEVKFIRGQEQLADIMTKPLAIQKFVSNRSPLVSKCLQLNLALITVMALAVISVTCDTHLGDSLTPAKNVTLMRTRHYYVKGTVLDQITIKRQNQCAV